VATVGSCRNSLQRMMPKTPSIGVSSRMMCRRPPTNPLFNRPRDYDRSVQARNMPRGDFLPQMERHGPIGRNQGIYANKTANGRLLCGPF